MTATPALLLATIATLGGCAAPCGSTLPDVAPELPTPDRALPGDPSPGVGEIDLDPAGSPPSSPVSLSGVVDELIHRHLPGPTQHLTASSNAAALTWEPSDSVDPTPQARRDQPEANGHPIPAGHLPPTGSRPSSQGEPVHATPSTATVHGRQVPADGARLAASILAGMAALGLYHKLSKDRALEHEARQRILAMLEAEPGLGTVDVADRLDVCYRTARHHLEVLARFDLVVRAKHRGKWRWARPEAAQAVAEPSLPEPQRRLLDLVEDEPGLHLSELARRLDLAKATVKLHLDRLVEAEQVDDERVGPVRRFFPSQKADESGASR